MSLAIYQVDRHTNRAAMEVPQPGEPATPIIPDAPVPPADPDPGTPADPERPATIPDPDEPATPAVPEPDPGSESSRGAEPAGSWHGLQADGAVPCERVVADAGVALARAGRQRVALRA